MRFENRKGGDIIYRREENHKWGKVRVGGIEGNKISNGLLRMRRETLRSG